MVLKYPSELRLTTSKPIVVLSDSDSSRRKLVWEGILGSGIWEVRRISWARDVSRRRGRIK